MGIKKRLSIERFRISVGYNTVGVFGIGLVIAKTMQDIILGLKGHIVVPLYILYPIGVGVLWLAGYLYEKTGMFSDEQNHRDSQNPYFKKHMEEKR